MVVVNALASDVEGELVPGSAHALLALRGGGTVGGRTRDEGGELKIVATVEGQIDDASIFDDGSERGGFAFDERGGGGDFHGFSDVADLHGDVDFGDLAGLEFEAIANLRTETGLFGANVVDARG